MEDNILEMDKMPSGAVAILSKASGSTVGIEIGTGCIFLEVEDLPDFLRLIKRFDLHLIGNHEPCRHRKRQAALRKV